MITAIACWNEYWSVLVVKVLVARGGVTDVWINGRCPLIFCKERVMGGGNGKVDNSPGRYRENTIPGTIADDSFRLPHGQDLVCTR